MIVTQHAIQRYRERVAPVEPSQAYAALSVPAFAVAEELGATAVILPSGHRAVCHDGAVVTVLPKPEPRGKRRG